MHLRAEVTEKLMVLIFKILMPLLFDKVFFINLIKAIGFVAIFLKIFGRKTGVIFT
jgi:hypothetical protein